ncbi:MAG TPA: hypothetical protein VL971_00695, partial [Rhizomicrobium sp.]|nr:hypothetical protein [Rhizomicrobium sp.]
MANKPIFFDASGKRAARLTVIGWIAVVASVLLGAAFVASLLAVPKEAVLGLPGAKLTAIHTPELENKAVAPGLLKSAEQLAISARAKKLERQRERRLAKQQEARRAKASTLRPQQGRPLSTAFYPNWEPSAYDSLQVALPQLDWVMPTWINLQGP